MLKESGTIINISRAVKYALKYRTIDEVTVALAKGKGVISAIESKLVAFIDVAGMAKLKNYSLTSDEYVEILDIVLSWKKKNPSSIMTEFEASAMIKAHREGKSFDEVLRAIEGAAEAINVAKTSLTSMRNAIKDRIIILKTSDGRIFTPQKIAMAVDMADPGNLAKRTYGFNRVWDSNPSIGDDIVDVVGKTPKEIAELYTKHNLDTLYNNSFIDDLFAQHPEHFAELGVTKDEIITEMEKLRTMLRNAKAEAAANSPIKAPDGSASFVKDWSIENCAEVWAMRNAILSGVKVDNIMLRTIKQVDGAFAELCDNCKVTFKKLIDEGRIITD